MRPYRPGRTARRRQVGGGGVPASADDRADGHRDRLTSVLSAQGSGAQWPNQSTSTSPRPSPRCPGRRRRRTPPSCPGCRPREVPRPVRRPNRQQAPRPGGALAALAAARASTRSARRATRATPPSRPRCAPPIRRCCTTVRAASSCSARARSSGSDPLRDVLLGVVAATEDPISGGRHKVFGRHDLARHPADLDDRLPPAARGRGGVLHRAGRQTAASKRRGPPTRSRCAASATRRPTTRPRSAPSTPPCTLPTRASAAAAVRLRGQRHRHQHQDPAGLDRRATTANRAGLRYFSGRRHRPARGLRRRRAGRRVGARRTASRRSCTCARCG